MSKFITFAGTSRVDGVLKFRTATDEKRIAQLAKLNDTEINLVELQPPAFGKADAVKALLAMGFGEGDAEVSELLTGMVKDENPFVKARRNISSLRKHGHFGYRLRLGTCLGVLLLLI